MKKPRKGGDKRQAVFVINTGGSGANLVNKYLGDHNFRFAGTMTAADLIILPDGLTGAGKVPTQLRQHTVILESPVSKIGVEDAVKAIRDECFLDIRTGANFSKDAVVAYITFWLNKLAKG